MTIDMNLGLDALLAIAIRAEMDAQRTYGSLAATAASFILKDKLTFLASEEEKHETILRGIFEKHYPGKEPAVPGDSVAPTPGVEADAAEPASELLYQAMEAELDAVKFYEGLSGKFTDPKVATMVAYMAKVEQSHYEMLKGERDALMDFEQYDEYHEMMHIGG